MGTGLDGEEPARRKHGISRSSRWFTSEHICRRKASPGRRLGATVTAVPVASGEALSCPWKKLSVAMVFGTAHCFCWWPAHTLRKPRARARGSAR